MGNHDPAVSSPTNDPEAVGALRHSLAGNPVPTSSPFFRDSIEPYKPADQGAQATEFSGHKIQPDGLMRRVFAAANALSYTGHLRPDDLRTAA